MHLSDINTQEGKLTSDWGIGLHLCQWKKQTQNRCRLTHSKDKIYSDSWLHE